MKQSLRRYEKFYYYDSDGVGAHLAKMAAKGWQLEAITPLYWKYRKAQPETLRYAVSYLAELSELDGRPNEGQAVFQEYCAQAGWDFVAQWAQMQIFVTRREDAPDLETDGASKLRTVHRTMKKSYLPGIALLLVLCAVQVAMQADVFRRGPVEALAGGMVLPNIVAFFLLGLCALLDGGGYVWWYVKSKRALERGGDCLKSTALTRWSGRVYLALAGVALALVGAGMLTGSLRRWLLPALLMAVGAVGLTWGCKTVLKRRGAPPAVTLAVTLLVCTGVPLLLVMASLSQGLMGSFGGTSLEIYDSPGPNGEVWSWETAYQDPLPLRAEDLYGVDYDHYAYRWEEKSSPALTLYTARQDGAPTSRVPELSYEIVEVKWERFYATCLEEYLEQPDWMADRPEEFRSEYREMQAPEWGAERVYRQFTGGEGDSQYLVCWGNRIVEITLEEPPTPVQIGIIQERLTGPLPRG